MAKRKKKAKKRFSKILKKVKVKKKVKPLKKATRKTGKGFKVEKRNIKKVVRKPSKGKEEKFEIGFEEVVVKCPSCGREFKVVKSSGFSMEGMLCQRCAAGGGGGLGEEDL